MSPQDHSNLPAMIPSNGVDTYRMSTDAAAICGAIVKATAQSIQGRKYVKVEGWQAIAVAHGCAASSLNVERVDGGVRAVGQVRRMDTGGVVAEAEGFVGEDEPVWFGGQMGNKTLPKRSDFAIRAMAQTRAISRACRSAFAHVVVMIDKDLSTTPAEEMQAVYENNGGSSGPVDVHGHPHKAAAAEGWAGSNGDVDPQDRGLTANAPKFTAGQLTRMKKWLEGATGTLALSGQTVGTLDGFWNEHAAKVEWLKTNMPEEHKKLDAIYMNARDAASARQPNAMQAG